MGFFFMMEKAVNLNNLQLIIATIVMIVFGTAAYLYFKYFHF